MDIQSFILISSFSSYAVRGLRGFQFIFAVCKNCYKTQTCNLVALIFGTNEECVMVDSRTKFAVNLSNIQGVMSIYSRKKIKLLSWLWGNPKYRNNFKIGV